MNQAHNQPINQSINHSSS